MTLDKDRIPLPKRFHFWMNKIIKIDF